MSLKASAQKVKEENEFMPSYETVKAEEIFGKECTIEGFTFYNATKDMYKDHPETVIVAMHADGKDVKVHFHNKQIVKTFKDVANNKEDVKGEVVVFKKIPLGNYNAVVIDY